ncbi:MAG: hypothetical protein QM784_22185 [Polyangiaceae bacterium]
MSLHPKCRRAVLFASSVAVLLLWSAQAGASELKLGGMHFGYGVGGAMAQTNAGLRWGADLAVVPLFEFHNSMNQDGFVIGPSAFIGFGDTPTYGALDVGWGWYSFGGLFVGGGPVYRYASDKMGKGYGFEGRVAFDLFFLQSGLRVMPVFGGGSSELVGTAFVGVGRF